MTTHDDILLRHNNDDNTAPLLDVNPHVASPGVIMSVEGNDLRPQHLGLVIVVDPFSTGTALATALLARHYAVVCVYSDTLVKMAGLIASVPETLASQFHTIVHHDPSREGDADDNATHCATLRATLQQLLDRQTQKGATRDDMVASFAAILPGAETGVPLADLLSEAFQTRTNGVALSQARRNKFTMGETIAAASLRAAHQSCVTSWDTMETFITTVLCPPSGPNQPQIPFHVIVKPLESAGSDDVFLCRSLAECHTALDVIQGKVNSLGLTNAATLVQEYLEGTEYVIDTVSRDGVHKVVAAWEYDKRRVNGADFVYFGLLLKPVTGPVMEALVSYVCQVCDALGLMNGPGHAEVKLLPGNVPVLVEIGSRCHGGNGSYLGLVNRCIGYNQVDVTLDAYISPKAFHNLPFAPTTLTCYGAEAMLVTYTEGLYLTTGPALNQLRACDSYLSDTVTSDLIRGVTVLPQTIDMFTTVGSIMLLHRSEKTLMEDYDAIRAVEVAGTLFTTTPLPHADTAEILPTSSLKLTCGQEDRQRQWSQKGEKVSKLKKDTTCQLHDINVQVIG